MYLYFSIRSVMDVEEVLEETIINETTFISVKNIVAAIYKPTDAFRDLEFNANDNEVKHFYFDKRPSVLEK